MTRFSCVFSIVLVGAGMVGCGSSDAPAPATAQNSTAADIGPDQVIIEFMTAVKSGNKAGAELLLSTVAREKTKAEGIAIDPPGSATMQFEVKEVQPLEMPGGQEAAHVSCIYTDKQPDGTVETQKIVWALRKEAIGWRIAGMAFTVFENEAPLFLDFENPADMIRKQQMLAEEMERRANPQAAQTAVAGTPNGTTTTPATPANPSGVQQTSGQTDVRQAAQPQVPGTR